MISPSRFSDVLLPLLRCPYCSSAFTFDESEATTLGRGAFGVLTCGCSEFPVLDDIPIIQRAAISMLEHTTGRVEVAGDPVADIVAMIRQGDTETALVRSLAVPRLSKGWRTTLGWRVGNSRIGAGIAFKLGQRELIRKVLQVRDLVRARDVLAYYYASHGPLNADVGRYFAHRFSQPRYLAALALVSRLDPDSRPVLDIACGTGHLEHYFQCRPERTTAVGLDMNFFHLWIARHWTAPMGAYVCTNANDGLPFIDDCFSAVVCSDAFHYIENKSQLLRCIERVAPLRPMILTRVGNAAVMPNEGLELKLDAYAAEIADPDLRVFGEEALVRDYLHDRNPFAGVRNEPGELRESKWLSLASNVTGRDHASRGSGDMPPHAVGKLSFNPIYSRSVRRDGSVRLEFEFPSIWYAYENHLSLAYHPRSVTITSEQERFVREGSGLEALRDLVDTFVVLGLPPQF